MSDPCDWKKLNIEVVPGMTLEPVQAIRRRTLEDGRERVEIVERATPPAENAKRCSGETDDDNNLRCTGRCTGGKVCMYQSEECPDGSIVEWCECELPA